MPQMNLAQARVVDPVLTQHARGYKSPGNVGVFLFPRVFVSQRGGKVVEFGKEAFRLYASARAPGSNTKRIQFGYEGKPFGIGLNSLEAVVPREISQEGNAVAGIDMQARAVSLVMRSLALSHEAACATIAQDAANYDAGHKIALAGAARWSDPASTPLSDVADYREAVRATTGQYPNTMLLGPKVFAALKTHPQVIDRIKYTGRDVVTTELLQSLFEVRRVAVGEAVTADAADAFVDVWGKNAVLAYVPETESFAMEEPSYGYTYTYAGHPAVEEGYYDNNAKSWIYPVSDDNTPVLTGITAGFLVQTAVA